MPEKRCIETIVRGSDTYFRLFALAGCMALHEGPVEWIAPKAGCKGPAIVYRAALPDEAALDGLLPGLKSGAVPPLWVLTPLSAPENLAELLLAKGFRELSKPERPEYGMALELKDTPTVYTYTEVRRVRTLPEFQAWMNVVNPALHGWELLTLEHYAVWLTHGAFAFYLGYSNGRPVATAATITQGNTATLEFVSTLPEYRRQGAGTAVCLRALRDLQERQTRTVTLRSSTEGYGLYRKLGFQPVFAQRLFSFEKKEI